MADQSKMIYKAGKAAGQHQVNKDEIIGKQRCETVKEEMVNPAGFLQQNVEQMKQMAMSAAGSMKNAVRLGGSSGGGKASSVAPPPTPPPSPEPPRRKAP